MLHFLRLSTYAYTYVWVLSSTLFFFFVCVYDVPLMRAQTVQPTIALSLLFFFSSSLPFQCNINVQTTTKKKKKLQRQTTRKRESAGTLEDFRANVPFSLRPQKKIFFDHQPNNKHTHTQKKKKRRTSIQTGARRHMYIHAKRKTMRKPGGSNGPRRRKKAATLQSSSERSVIVSTHTHTQAQRERKVITVRILRLPVYLRVRRRV